MKILVTGSSGFIGKQLVEELKKNGHEVVPFDRTDQLDVLNLDQVHEKMEGCEAVYHLAGLHGASKSIENVQDFLLVNVLGTLNVLRVAKNRGAKVIFTSSSTAREAKSPYGISKLHAETYARWYNEHYGLQLTILRPYTVYGPGMNQGVIKIWFENTGRALPIKIFGDGNAVSDYIYIEDMVDALMKCLNKQAPSWPIDICTGRGISLKQVANIINNLSNRTEILYEPARPEEVTNNVGGPHDAKNHLDFEAKVLIYEGLEKTGESL